MSSNRLNVLTVGSNPNLMYYSWKLNNTGRFKFHVFNEDLSSSIPIILEDDNGTNIFKPDVLYSQFNQFSLDVKFDIIFLSSKSLQDISNLSANLSPFLNPNTIIIVESTGFVNLEPFLKNGLPSSSSSASILSILTNLDIRKTDINKYLVLPTANPTNEIILGESNTKNVKYQPATLKNLSIIAKIFQSSINEAKIILKNTYLEFLTEEWKMAIPQICFNPLLILFEESQPNNLSNQILAKPLLSGLITELITVAKTMGCRLPLGYDNESNFFKNWCEQYPNSTSSSNIKYLESPRFFYDFYHKNNLDIDMLLLQPILLADDYGIKTPYLEFLYATICQFDKFNNEIDGESIFFKRSNDSELKHLINSNELLNSKLDAKDQEISDLNLRFQDLSMINDKNKEKDIQFNSLMSNYEALKSQHQQIQQQLQQRNMKYQQLESQNRSLQASANAARQQVPQQIPQQQVPQQQVPQQQQPVQTPVDRSNESPVHYDVKHSIDGTPDLRDLTDVALLGSSMESPIKQRQNSQLSQLPQQLPPSAPGVGEYNDMNGENGHGYNNTNNNNNTLQQPAQVLPQLSSKEIELKKKEQLLQSKEMELNKKLQQLRYQQQPHAQTNGGYVNGNGHNGHHFNPRNNQVVPGPNGLQQVPHQSHQPHLVNGLPNINTQLPQGPSQGAPPGVPQGGVPHHQHQGSQTRRVSTMPVLDSNDMFNNPQFKKTSRKNRKSSFPLVTPGMDSNYGMPMQTSLDNRFRPQSHFQGPPNPQAQGQGQGVIRPNPTKALTSPTIPTTAGFSNGENPYNSSNSNSSNEINHEQQQAVLQPPVPMEDAKPLGTVIDNSEKEKKKQKKGLFRKK